MNSIEIAKLLKKHARYGNGVFAITIDEHDPDYKAVIEWMEQDAYKTLRELEESNDSAVAELRLIRATGFDQAEIKPVPIIETMPASAITQEEWEDFWNDR